MPPEPENNVTYARAFFDLQLQFAHKVALLSGLPLARALLEYTNLYARFGLGRDFDPAHPTWREYLAGLRDPNEYREWTYRFYLKRPEILTAPGRPCDPFAGSANDPDLLVQIIKESLDVFVSQNPQPSGRSPEELADAFLLHMAERRKATP